LSIFFHGSGRRPDSHEQDGEMLLKRACGLQQRPAILPWRSKPKPCAEGGPMPGFCHFPAAHSAAGQYAKRNGLASKTRERAVCAPRGS
jgi:hypothetical protein